MVWFCPVEECSRHFERGISTNAVSNSFSFSSLGQLQSHCEEQRGQESSPMGMLSPISEADVDKSAQPKLTENTDNANKTTPVSRNPPPSPTIS